jgi:hypothetical protein
MGDNCQKQDSTYFVSVSQNYADLLQVFIGKPGIAYLSRSKGDIVKPVCNDHPWDQKNVVVVDRWSLLRRRLMLELKLELQNVGPCSEVVVSSGFKDVAYESHLLNLKRSQFMTSPD